MNKKKWVLFIFVGFAIFSCQSGIDLKSDKQLNAIFAENELNEIEKMIDYVDDRVIEQTGNKDIDQAYHQFLNELFQTIQSDSTYLAPLEEEDKYKFLESLDATVFNDFWYMGNHLRMGLYKDSIYKDLDNYKYLDLRHTGRYSDYLERIGENDDYYRSVKESLDFAAGLAPSIVASFLKRHNGFDFTIPKNRLWSAVFILAIEESHEKKMERYLKQSDD